MVTAQNRGIKVLKSLRYVIFSWTPPPPYVTLCHKSQSFIIKHDSLTFDQEISSNISHNVPKNISVSHEIQCKTNKF